MKIKLLIEYKGTSFCGWQKQPAQESVQETISNSIKTFFLSESKKQSLDLDSYLQTLKLEGSGRTDAGVHAFGQVACFNWPEAVCFDEYSFISSLNGILKKRSVSIITATIAEDSFHPRKSAKEKTYLYKILNRQAPPTIENGLVWHIKKIENYEEMINATSIFNGIHDFNFFRASDCNAKSSIRKIFENKFTRTGSVIEYEISGNGFLKNQVRFILGALIAVGKNKLKKEDLISMLENKKRFNIQIAPAHGLYLKEVRY